MTLSFRLAAAFVAFVVLGSLALVVWLGVEEWRQSREQFAATARMNAEFIRAQNLPLTERTADALGKVLGMDVRFNTESGWIPEWPNSGAESFDSPSIKQILFLHDETPGKVDRLENGREVVTVPLDGKSFLLLSRPGSLGVRTWAQPRTYVVLAAFWALCIALAVSLARGIVRPLHSLAERLPRISQEKDEPIPETSRSDEIGQLARAYAETRAQLATERSAREQAERLATLGKMATGLAHEINNPVAAIKLHAQLMEDEIDSELAPPIVSGFAVAGHASASPLGVRQWESDTQPRTPAKDACASRLQIILAETAKIEGLVSQWMFLARPQPPQVFECDFAGIIVDAIRTHGPAAEHARVKVTNEIGYRCAVRGDRRRLAQAVANVFTNAIHAMSASGGTLTIRGTNKPAASGGGRETIEIQFIDNGIGFSPAGLARATELFFSEKEGGMGIGLSVTSEILRGHGGELRLANAPGGGAIVTVIIPAAGQ